MNEAYQFHSSRMNRHATDRNMDKSYSSVNPCVYGV